MLRRALSAAHLACAALWWVACAAGPQPQRARPADLSTAAQSEQAGLRGDLNCRPDETDCNVCAPNVLAQFEALADPARAHWRDLHWQADTRAYPPSNLTLSAAAGRQWIVPRKHVQGFAHTGSARYPYAVSYSHDEHGSLLWIGRDADGQLRLTHVFACDVRHPSGIQALGDHVLMAEGKRLRVLHVDAASRRLEAQRLTIPRKDPERQGMRGAGGGLGAARLGPEEFLLAINTPGGEKPGPRTTRFYVLRGPLDALRSARYLGETRYAQPPAWHGDLRYSENLSLITECDTGQLYAAHTTGDAKLGGHGYLRVSRVEGARDAPRLTPLAVYPMAQDSGRCHWRSAATVYVDREDGTLRLVCHQRARRGWEKDLEFRERAPR